MSISFLTAGYLVAGLLAGVGIGFIVGSPKPGALHAAQNVVAGVIAVACMTVAAAKWGREIARRIGALDLRRATWAGALSFGPVSLVVGLVLTVLERVIVEQGRGPALPIHVVYGLLFVPGAFVIAAFSALILGVGLRRDSSDLVRLALASGVAACAVYLGVYLAMDAAGFRVGGPDAAKRATMLVVTALSCLGASLAGGAAIGWVLLRAPSR
jgi:hypothetical protein